MKRVCAWCNREMGVVAGSSHPDTEISHGICEAAWTTWSSSKGCRCRGTWTASGSGPRDRPGTLWSRR